MRALQNRPMGLHSTVGGPNKALTVFDTRHAHQMHAQLPLSRKHRVSCGRITRVGNRIHCSAEGAIGLFPAGKKQARVKIPSLVVTIGAGEVARGGSGNASLAARLDDAVAGGVTAVLLTDEGADGSAQLLYEAALKVKEILRGRADLLLLDRSDLAGASGAEGAVMGPRGLPVVVAKRALGEGALVGKLTSSPEEAAAAAADGASLVMLVGGQGEVPQGAAVSQARRLQRSNVSIPLLVVVADDAPLPPLRSALGARIEGLVLPLARIEEAARVLGGNSNSITAAVSSLLKTIATASAPPAAPAPAPAPPPPPPPPPQTQPSPPPPAAAVAQDFVRPAAAAAAAAPAAPAAPPKPPVIPGSPSESSNPWYRMERGRVVSANAEALVGEERALLGEVLGAIRKACPELSEVSLLSDALKQLDELFLVVVVGEFNSGKSSVINALLGDRYLAEGVLPTTNEIQVLKYRPGLDRVGELEQTVDGLAIRYLSAPLLSDVNIVDTPGTNVILGRQQRLTEEFVPRADLVLFVMSADRPFTDSEVGFLRYIRQWSKKVVFVLNKSDLLEGPGELQAVTDFVRDNAQRVLGLEGAAVLSVSARKAMRAKLNPDNSPPGLALQSAELERLSEDETWQESRFEALESYLVEFLSGSAGGGGTGGEVFRLKLQTPVSVAEALLDAAIRTVKQDLEYSDAQVSSLSALESQLSSFRAVMEKDGEAQRGRIRRAVMDAVGRAERTVDSLVQLSNFATLSAYLTGSTDAAALPVAQALDPRGELVGSLTQQVSQQTEEHAAWLRDNVTRQLAGYRGFVERQAASLGADRPGRGEAEGGDVGALEGPSPSASFRDLLDPRKMEEDVREVVLTTGGLLGGSVGSLVVLTGIFQSGFEDLLAVLLAGALGYLGVVTLPLRKGEVKRRLRGRGEEYAEGLERRLEEQLQSGLSSVEATVRGWARPLLAAAQAERSDVATRLARLEGYQREVEELKTKVANLR